MLLTDEHIVEFQMLYKKHFGTDISKEDALAKGIRLIRLMEIVLKHEAELHTDKNYNYHENNTK